MEIELFIIWIVCVVIGMMIRVAKGQDSSAVIWPVLLGPLGVLIVLCLPNLIKEQAARDQRHRQLKLIELQEAQLRELRALRNPPPPVPPSAPPTKPPPERKPSLEEFVPDNLRGWKRGPFA